MHDPEMQPPVNPLPPPVVVLFLAMAGVEAILSLAEAGMLGGRDAIGWRLALVQDFGFSGDIFDWMLANGQWPLEHVLRFFTFPFIHHGVTHGIFAIVLLLALGKLVAEIMGQVAFVSIFFLSGIGGVSIYALLLNDPTWVTGGYPNVYGLIGGYSFVMWRTLGAAGEQQLRAFSLIALLMAIQLIWGIFFQVGTQWVAELAGFFCGFGLSFVLAPGEWAKITARIRRH